MIKPDRVGVVNYWADIVRAGRRVAKLSPVAARPPRYEYWGYPPAGSTSTHKLGHVQKFGLRLGWLSEENGTLTAIRRMKAGTQFQAFGDIRKAEDWIAECDRWGALQVAVPKSQRASRKVRNIR